MAKGKGNQPGKPASPKAQALSYRNMGTGSQLWWYLHPPAPLLPVPMAQLIRFGKSEPQAQHPGYSSIWAPPLTLVILVTLIKQELPMTSYCNPFG